MRKEFKKENFILTHSRYVDDFGFEVDSMDLFDEIKRVHYPFHGFPKVSNQDKNFPINKIPYNYTEEDYEEMLDKQKLKVGKNIIRN